MRGAVEPRFGHSAVWRRGLSGNGDAAQGAPGPGTRLESPDRLGMHASHLFGPGVELFQQGSAASGAFYLERGLVKLTVIQADGREVVVGIRSSGSVLAAASVLAEHPHPTSATTITRCRAALIEADELRRRVREDASLSWQLHRLHSEELDAQLARVADLCALPALDRLRRFLGELLALLARETGDRPRRIPLKQSEVAGIVGVTPQYLCRLLDELEADGSLRRDRGCLVLFDH